MRYILSSLVLVFALVLAFNPMIAAQQQRDVPSQGVNTVDDRRDGPDLGWLGLVGLIGLAGLRRRDSRDHAVIRTDPHPSASR
jgi:MYXO-CTERM domain-containing protein